MQKIVCLKGDGIGGEIMDSMLEVWHALMPVKEHFALQFCDFGGVAIDKYGTPLPDSTLDACLNAKAVMLACIGAPKYQHAQKTPEQGLLELRKSLGLYCNLRPICVSEALKNRAPLRSEILQGSDFVIVRELISGIYFGTPRVLQEDHAIDTCSYRREEIERILRCAFELARSRRKHVVSVDKANVLATSKLWRQVAEELHEEFKDCVLEHQYVDSMAMKILLQPRDYDVIVTENLFGDILSDEASVLLGSLGVCPSVSMGEGGRSLYEPIHGSAPDIAGKGIANPVGMIFCLALMLEFSFGDKVHANRIRNAVESCFANGIFTPDLGGETNTKEFTEAVVDCLKRDGAQS
ncbi:3-isopropylmalate dehydrogenase [Helicobacter mustelae]|uniref:3-isopropylmalate dehydrogenase n=1 Tax=Helicobacter mustelae (strain ATCC 43772 / CCUG 25715 / CIP 103759 / LMG 18044 / NCTC 12198 / R85-136P) TaxID=679897 RepID=D3UIF1_HELM1|nr:3-isopropylmalate dehydrogenase [Helicobacter mustelae]CBG40274.1 3-isopropylmalate dehydrogenase [Helicobacter mustelae 12198]SQH71774.1 3-isopropylmalate dehydrogenase [Helicobacter mustelae]STP12903.1 3-isopropylmalate dehydrogenase [Helicobacter mustelae]